MHVCVCPIRYVLLALFPWRTLIDRLLHRDASLKNKRALNKSDSPMTPFQTLSENRLPSAAPVRVLTP